MTDAEPLDTPLSRDEMIAVIEGRGAARRVPVLLHFWTHPTTFGDRQGAVERLLARWPHDVQVVPIRMPAVYETPGDGLPFSDEYRWVDYDRPPTPAASAGLDAQVAIDDWARLDGVLEHFPDPRYGGLLAPGSPPDGRYRLGTWWFCLFERHWQLRGMANALTDYYTAPEAVHRLFRALTDFYLAVMERAARERGVDGFMTSDDLGTQTGTFFSTDVFDEFFRPYYRELIARAHELGRHFWLHACGNIESFLPGFIDLGLDVIHPIQKYTMDEREIARKFGGRITFWAGFDVQRIIPWGTADEVRDEVRAMIDTYWRPEGRFMLTAGNGINGDCPLPSLEALYEEAFTAGKKERMLIK
ncbi:MAG: hypothetical protein M1457_05365 [bacterium]|nr:hypothetical protein [bacterium]